MGFYKGKNVLVTGGTGLIGRPLVDLLLKEEATITIVSLDQPKDLSEKVTFKNNGLKIFNIFPNWILNSFTIKLLNTLFYNLTSESKKQLSINDYFYQLDKMNWMQQKL